MTGAVFVPDAEHARALDEGDELSALRARFRLPRRDGAEAVYFAGHSLGLQPVEVPELIRQELDAWAEHAVDAHFSAAAPWYSYHEDFREPTARLVGARPEEVVVMNGLTTNLHLMLVSFYRPTTKRHAIVIESCAFPSDTYALRSQIRFHGGDPDRSLWVVRPREGEDTIRPEDVDDLLERSGDEIALVLLGGVNYFTGQYLPIATMTETAHSRGCIVGCDLAHTAGNLPLQLHDWNVDFAVWCGYKYLNAGPGGGAGCFVHERHIGNRDLPRFAGWWGNDPASRFRMHLEPEFRPVASADAWQLSNPPILSMAPLRASLRLFDEAGMERLRARSLRLTAYLESWIDHVGDPRIRIMTPRDPSRRGSMLSLFVAAGARALADRLHRANIVVDYREPDVIRASPVPLYNSFEDIRRFGEALLAWSRETAA